jgi:hypothetical protein
MLVNAGILTIHEARAGGIGSAARGGDATAGVGRAIRYPGGHGDGRRPVVARDRDTKDTETPSDAEAPNQDDVNAAVAYHNDAEIAKAKEALDEPNPPASGPGKSRPGNRRARRPGASWRASSSPTADATVRDTPDGGRTRDDARALDGSDARGFASSTWLIVAPGVPHHEAPPDRARRIGRSRRRRRADALPHLKDAAG